MCECSDDTCTETVHVSLEKYEAVRANARQFLLVPGHEGAFERVVERGDGYVVVEKEGEAGRLAEQTDPHAG